MAIDPRKKQKQLEKKAARRKEVRAAKKDTHGPDGAWSSARQMDAALRSPIHECLTPEELFSRGIGNVIVSRKLPNGDIAASFFLLDVYCLGVKSAFFLTVPESEYIRKAGTIDQSEKLMNVDPSYARKLVEGAAAYAKEIGIAPHPDYQLAGRIFGDIDAGSCSTEFVFGKDGKPFFVRGLNDTPARCRKIMDALSKRFGPDGFGYLMVV